MNDYFTEYPTHIEVPEDYWVITTFFNIDVQYSDES